MHSTWLVTFDVPGDRARRALTRRLEQFGPRVAHSVYVLRADDDRVDRLLTGAVDLIGKDGHLLALPFCPDCVVIEHGRDLEQLPNPGWVIW